MDRKLVESLQKDFSILNEKKSLKQIAKKLSKSGKVNTVDDFTKAAKKHGYSDKDVGKHLAKDYKKHADEYDPSEGEWDYCPDCGKKIKEGEDCRKCGWENGFG